MKKRILLLIMGFFLTLPHILAISVSDQNNVNDPDKILLNLHFDRGNCTIDDSKYQIFGEASGTLPQLSTSTKFVGNGSCNFQGSQKINYGKSSPLAEMVNMTVGVCVNTTTTGAIRYIYASEAANAAGRFSLQWDLRASSETLTYLENTNAQLTTGTGEIIDFQLTPTHFNCYFIVRNHTGGYNQYLYVNNSINKTGTSVNAFTSIQDNFYVGWGELSNNYGIDGFDELMIWNFSLNQDQLDYVMDAWSRNITLPNDTIIVVPSVSLSINDTNPSPNNPINISATITGENGLLFGNITYNLSGVVTKINFSISGTSTTIHNITTSATEQTINVTVYGTDVTNLVSQTSQLITFKNKPTNLTLTLVDLYDNSTLTNFTARVFNNSDNYLVRSGTSSIIFTNLSAGTYSVNFSSNQSGGYFNQSFINKIEIIKDSANVFQGDTFQSVLNVTASIVVNGSGIGSFWARIGTQLNQSTTGGINEVCAPEVICDRSATLFLRKGSYNITINKTGFYLNATENFTIQELEYKTLNIELGTIRLKINASKITGEIISNFDINLVHNNSVYSKNKTTTTNEVFFDLIESTYNFTLRSSNILTSSSGLRNLNVTDGFFHNYSFSIYSLNSINLSFFDELIGKFKYFNNDSAISLTIESTLFSANYTLHNDTFYIDLLEPQEYRLSFSTPKYTERDYYFTLRNDTYNSFDLYMLSTGNSTDITVTVVDEAARELQGAIIKILRYYPVSNTYEIIGMSKTDANGQFRFNIQQFGAFYYFVVEYNNEVVLTTTGARIITTSFTLNTFISDSVWSSREKLHQISHLLIYDNSTQRFELTYTDNSNILKQICLIVDILKPQSTIQICNNCSSSTSGTILCRVNATEGNLRAYGRLDTTTENSPHFTDILEILSYKMQESIDKFSGLGVYLTAYGFMVLALLGTPFPYISIPLSIIGLLFSSFMGILGISYIGIVTIIILGSLIIYQLRR